MSKNSYSPAQDWKPYLGDNAPSVDGVFTEKDIYITSDTYIGRTVVNNTYVLGKIKTSNPAGLYYYENGNENLLTTDVEYMTLNPAGLYNWVASSSGQPVLHAFQLQLNSAQWPILIGRVLINNTYVLFGKVIPGTGLVVTDQNGQQQIIPHYQVLTCATMNSKKIYI